MPVLYLEIKLTVTGEPKFGLSMNNKIQEMTQYFFSCYTFFSVAICPLLSVALTQMLPCSKFGDSIPFVFLKMSFTRGETFVQGQEHKYGHIHADAHEGYHLSTPLLIQRSTKNYLFLLFLRDQVSEILEHLAWQNRLFTL